MDSKFYIVWLWRTLIVLSMLASCYYAYKGWICAVRGDPTDAEYLFHEVLLFHPVSLIYIFNRIDAVPGIRAYVRT